MSYELLPKEILYNEDVLDKLEEGVKAAHDAISVTMGPSGQLVMYEEDQKNPYPTVTKDGVSVASMIAFEDQAINNGAQFVIQAARKQVYETGDGTTLTSIMTYKLFKEGRKLMSAGYSPNMLISGIRKAIKDIVSYIEKESQKDLSITELKNIARVSTNNDVELADKIAEVVYKTGKYGMVFQERSPNDKHEVEYQDGYQLDIGILDKDFANKSGLVMSLNNPFILITDQNIVAATQLLPILEQIREVTPKDNKPELVIFAPQIGGDVLQCMKINITSEDGEFFMVHIRPTADLKPEKNKMVMEDLAAITGGMFISQDSGQQIDKLKLKHLGTCENITSYQVKTLITGFSEKAKIRVNDLKEQRKLIKDPYTKEIIDESIARLSGGVATIKVGGRNLTEQSETLFRVDDAVSACKSAQEMGYVRGGGVVLLQAYRQLKKKRRDAGYELVLESLKYPTQTILKNAKREDYENIISTILKNMEVMGYDINNEDMLDMYDLHIIDPTKVITYALKNAASAAISMLQTSVMIISKGESNASTTTSNK